MSINEELVFKIRLKKFICHLKNYIQSMEYYVGIKTNVEGID